MVVLIEFNYKQRKTSIKINLSDSFETIIHKYINQTKLDINNILFSSNDKNINNNETIENIMTTSQKEKNKLEIFVYDINYLCNKHNELFKQYCEDCDEDICSLCLPEHEYHFLEEYEDKSEKIKDIRKKMKILKNVINIFKENLKEIIIKMKKIMEYVDNYYNIKNP